MDIVAEKIKEDENPLEVFKKALANVTPAVEVRSRRIGGATFQIPAEIRPDRKVSVGIKNMIKFARKRNEKTWLAGLPGKLSLPAKKKELHSSVKRIPIVWLMPTRRSLILDFKKEQNKDCFNIWPEI